MPRSTSIHPIPSWATETTTASNPLFGLHCNSDEAVLHPIVSPTSSAAASAGLSAPYLSSYTQAFTQRTQNSCGAAETDGPSNETLAIHCFRQRSNLSSSQQKTTPKERKCTFSLSLSFFVLIIVVGSVFFPLSWVSLHIAATHSIESATSRMHQMAGLVLQREVGGLLRSIVFTGDTLRTAVEQNSQPDNLRTLFFNVLQDSAFASSLLYHKTNGEFRSVSRDSADVFSYREGSPCLSLNDSNPCFDTISVWRLNQTTGVKIEPPQKLLHDWSPVGEIDSPTFLAPVYHSTGIVAQTLAFPIPSFDTTLSVQFGFSSLFLAFETVLQRLQTSGAVVLVNGNDPTPLVSVGRHPTDADILALNAIPKPIPSSGGMEVTVVKLKTFGDSYVLDASLANMTEPMEGLLWRVFLIVPKSECLSELEKLNTTEIWLVTGCLICYFLLVALFTRVSLTIPLRRHLRQLKSLKSLLEASSTTSVVTESLIDPADMPTSSSYFTELADIHDGIVQLIKAAEVAVEQRVNELVRRRESEQANEQTQQLMRGKDIFFAMMSHEMRTPLTACIGMAQVLLGTSLSPEQKECADGILFGGEMMLGLVNNILDFSKLEADKLALENIPFNLRGVLEKVVQTVEIKAEEKQLELILEISADIPEECLGDPSRLSQVLLNLLSNSIKFTSSGFVLLSCEVDREIGQIKFAVVDTGIGLDHTAMAQLFEPFVQASSSISRKYGGTGLGLAICRRIVLMMGGDIEVQSEGSGCGSTFRFSIKYNESEQDTRTKLGAMNSLASTSAITITPKARIQHISIVDSLIPRRHALKCLFEAMQVYVTEFGSFEELKLLGQESPIPSAHIVFCHAQEAGLDGDAILDTLIQHTGTEKDYQLVIVTNLNNTPPTSANTNQLVYVSKPLTVKKLKYALATLHENDDSDGHTSESDSEMATPRRLGGAHPSPRSKTARILIVDDVVLNQRVITMKLKQFGFEYIDVASGGLQAIRMATESEAPYQVILMDVMMPDLDGYETTRRIKALPRYQRVPILGLTGDCTVECSAACEAAGMLAVLAKPIDNEALFRKLRAALRNNF